MSEVLRAFEKNPEISEILGKGFLQYSESLNNYIYKDPFVALCPKPSQQKEFGYINGAWIFYQKLSKEYSINTNFLKTLNVRTKQDAFFLKKYLEDGFVMGLNHGLGPFSYETLFKILDEFITET